MQLDQDLWCDALDADWWTEQLSALQRNRILRVEVHNSHPMYSQCHFKRIMEVKHLRDSTWQLMGRARPFPTTEELITHILHELRVSIHLFWPNRGLH